MVIVTSRMVSKKEKREELLLAIRGMLEPTRVESGCLNYRLYQDIENKNAFMLLEEWETQEDLDEHLLTVNYRNLLMLMDLLIEPPEIKFNTISRTAGIEIVQRVLGSARKKLKLQAGRSAK